LTSIVSGIAVARNTGDQPNLQATRTGGHAMTVASRGVQISGLRGAAALRARGLDAVLTATAKTRQAAARLDEKATSHQRQQ